MKTFGKTYMKAVGVTFKDRQGKLWNIRKQMNNGEKLTIMLRREPSNPYDKNAIAVLAQCGESTAKVGYVPADKALWLAERMDAGLSVRAYKGMLTGGSGRAKTIGLTFEVVYELPVAEATEPADHQ
jgi:hypothetical protein